MKYESNEQLQRIVDYAAAQQRQQEAIQRAQQAGDLELAAFYSQPPEVQQTMLARQDIEDAAAAANAGDIAGVQHGIANAINRVLYQGAQLGNVRQQRPAPRRRVR